MSDSSEKIYSGHLLSLPLAETHVDLHNAVYAKNGLEQEQLAELKTALQIAGIAPEIRFVKADEIEQILAKKDIIVPGCLNNSEVVEYFYLREMAFHDRVNPGNNEFIARTLVSPTGAGNVLFLGASEPAGQSAAIKWFGQQLAKHGASLPPLHYVKRFKDWPPSSEQEGPLRYVLAPLEDDRERFSFNRFSHAALVYLYSGTEEDGKRLRDLAIEMARAGDTPTDLRQGSIKQANHYFSHRMAWYWQLVEHLPVFSNEDRLEIINALLDHYNSHESSGCVELCRQNTGKPGERHLMMMALNTWVEADYFRRRLGDAGREWSKVAGTIQSYFEPIWASSKGLSGLIEGYGSYLTVALQAAMLMGRANVLREKPMRLWCERLLAVCGNMGMMAISQQTDPIRWPDGIMAVIAYMLNDGRFKYLQETRKRVRVFGVEDKLLCGDPRLFPSGSPKLPQDHLGLKALLADENCRRHYAPDADPLLAYDTISGRSGYEFDNEYFLFQGIRSGAKYSYIIGAMTTYERFGYRLFGDTTIGISPMLNQIRNTNSLSVIRDGQAEMPPGAAEVLSCQKHCDDWQAIIRLAGYNGTDWYRTIYWRPNEFLLIRDAVQAKQAGEYCISNYWNAFGVALDGYCGVDSFRFEGGPGGVVFGHLENVGHASYRAEQYKLPDPQGLWPRSSMVNMNPLWQMSGKCWPYSLHHSSMLELEPGQAWCGYTLIHAGREAKTKYRIDEHNEETVNISGEKIALTAMPEVADFLRISSGNAVSVNAISESSADVQDSWQLDKSVRHWVKFGQSFAMACDDAIYVLRPGGKCTELATGAAVSALAASNDRLCAATAMGDLIVYDQQGCKLWRKELEILDLVKPYYWWVWQSPVATSLYVGPLGKDGRDVIAAGSASASLALYDLDGKQLWHEGAGWGAVNGLQAIKWDDEIGLVLLHGFGKLSSCGHALVVDKSGETIARFGKACDDDGIRKDYLGWDICGLPFAQVVEWKGEQVLVLCRAGTFNNLAVYRLANQEALWSRDVGRYITGFAYDKETATVTIGTDQGLVANYDMSGEQQWHYWCEEAVHSVAIGPKGYSLVGTTSRILMIDSGSCISLTEGRLLGVDGRCALVEKRGHKVQVILFG